MSNNYLRAASLLAGLALVAACGELLTSEPDARDLLDAPLPGLPPEQSAAFARGDAEFAREFAPASGLGPVFNNTSCAACHSGDGRGRPENALIRFGTPPGMGALAGGPQVQDKAIPGAVPEAVPDGYALSVRLPPPVFGVGLIEAIPETEILLRADPADLDGDGISGVPNLVHPPAWVPPSEPGGVGPALGRFGRKAQTSTLLQQVVEAYHQDMGITTDFLPDENVNPLAAGLARAADLVADPEVPRSTVHAVVDYLRMLAPPEPGELTPAREAGAELFSEIGCAACHIPSFETGPSPIPELANRTVTLYSDLLLHDMGPELADNRPDGLAGGSEWRTAPLWGLRVMRDFLNGDAFLLHDGRARSVDEAIRLHGGEAGAARDRYAALADDARAALLDFVESR